MIHPQTSPYALMKTMQWRSDPNMTHRAYQLIDGRVRSRDKMLRSIQVFGVVWAATWSRLKLLAPLTY